MRLINWVINTIRDPFKSYWHLKYKYYKKKQNYKKSHDALYYALFHKKINWENPTDLNQWIQWLTFNSDISLWSLLADKYKVRDYIKEKGYEKNLIPLLAVWDSPEKINFDKLPEQFIIKMNNGSGDSVIIKNKHEENLDKLKENFRTLFLRDFGRNGEIHYSFIKPKIIVETLMDAKDQTGYSTSLIDYKF